MDNRAAGTRYIDLFDDDLYDWSTFENKNHFEKHLDTVRMKALVFLLFEGSVCVPEQWLASSPVFCQVAAEVVTPWLKRYKAGTLGSQRTPPFLPAYFEGVARADEPFLEALRRRLIAREDGKNSPIRLSRKLDFEKEPDIAFKEREKFRLAIEAEFNKPPRLASYEGEFASIVHEALEDVNQEEEIDRQKIAGSFLKLCEYFQILYQNDHRRLFQPSAYHQDLEQLISQVQRITEHSGPLDEFDTDRRRQFEEFFRRIRNDPGRPSLSELTLIRRHAAGLDADAQRSILYTGRYCMHRSLAKALNAEFQSVSFPLYEAGRPDEFDDLLTSQIRQFEIESSEAIDSHSGDLPRFQLDSADLLISDPALIGKTRRLSWAEIWEAFWEYRLSRKWHVNREKLKRQIESNVNYIAGNRRVLPPDLMERTEQQIWQDIFGELNVELQHVKFEMAPNDSSYVRLVTKAAAISGISAAMFDAISATAGFGSTIEMHVPILTWMSPLQLAIFSTLAYSAGSPSIVAKAERGMCRLRTLTNKYH